MQKSAVIFLPVAEKDEKLHIVWKWLLASLLTAGTLLTLRPCLTGNAVRPWVIAVGVFACALPAAVQLMAVLRQPKASPQSDALQQQPDRIKRIAAAAPAGIAVLLLLLAPSSTINGILNGANGLIVLWNTKYEDAVPLLGQGLNDAVTTFGIAAALLTGTVMWYAVSRRAAVGLGVWTFVLLALAQFFGYADAVTVCLLVCGLLGVWFLWVTPVPSGAHVLWSACAVLLAVVCAAAVPEGSVRAVAQVKASVTDAFMQFRYGKDALPKGRLADAYEMHEEEETVLLVQTESIGAMYLRGFTAGRYADGEWKELPKFAYRGEKEGMMDWLSEEGFSPQNQYGSYASAAEEQTDEAALTAVSVQNVGADRRYIYLPYSFQNLEGVSEPEGDSSADAGGLRGQSSYRFGECASGLPSELLHTDTWVAAPQTERQRSYLEAEKVYRTFVYENYLETDAETQTLIGSLFWPSGSEWDLSQNEFTLYEATDHIRKVLAGTVQYTKTPAQLPAGSDPIKWFLTESKAGNAPFFATVTVLAFRQAGFPARYAEGYLLREGAVSSDGEAALTSQDGHAWAEVYLDGVSWLPVDTTPGYYYDAYSLQQMLTRPQDSGQTAQLNQEGRDEAQEIVSNEGTVGEGAEKKENGFTLRTAAGILTCALLLAALVWLAVCLIRLTGWLVFCRRYRAASGTLRTSLLFDRILSVLHSIGVDGRLGCGERETDAALSNRRPDVEPGEYIRVHRLAEKAVYGQTELKAYEQRVMEAFLKKIIKRKRRK